MILMPLLARKKGIEYVKIFEVKEVQVSHEEQDYSKKSEVFCNC